MYPAKKNFRFFITHFTTKQSENDWVPSEQTFFILSLKSCRMSHAEKNPIA